MAVIAVATLAEGTSGRGAFNVPIFNGGRKRRLAHLQVTGGTGYATGGVDCTSLLDAFKSVDGGFCNVENGSARVATFAPSTKKVQIFTALGTEAANGSDQTAAGVIDVFVIGR